MGQLEKDLRKLIVAELSSSIDVINIFKRNLDEDPRQAIDSVEELVFAVARRRIAFEILRDIDNGQSAGSIGDGLIREILENDLISKTRQVAEHKALSYFYRLLKNQLSSQLETMLENLTNNQKQPEAVS